MKKVVVTGIGAVSPIGNSFPRSWEAARAGLSGIAPIEKFDISEIKWKVAGEIKGFDAEAYLSRKDITRSDPFVHYAVAASLMAAEDAGLAAKGNEQKRKSDEAKKQGSREDIETFGLLNFGTSELDAAGVIIGSSRGGISTIDKLLQRAESRERRTQNYGSRLSPFLMPSSTVSAAASYVAQKMGIKGHCLGISNACASGTNAIGEAYRLIKSGSEGVIFCGGTEAPVCRLCLEGYGSAGALSGIDNYTASRPFDIRRDGFVLSEGACILVLEEYERAVKRGARIYGEIIGYGNTADAFHQTRPSPDGEVRAMITAMNEAGLDISDIDLISAHATSTQLGDKAEADAIKLVFGQRARDIPVTSLKSITGHMLSASGAFEAAVALMSLNEGIITPTINLKQKDPECELNCITEPVKADITTVISNSFGFGGVNAVLVFKRRTVSAAPRVSSAA